MFVKQLTLGSMDSYSTIPFRKQYQYCTSILTRTGKHQSFFHLVQMYPVVKGLGNAPYGPYRWRIRIIACRVAPRQRLKVRSSQVTKSVDGRWRSIVYLLYTQPATPSGNRYRIHPLLPECPRSPNPFLIPVVIHAHHLSPAQAHQGQYRRQLASIRP